MIIIIVGFGWHRTRWYSSWRRELTSSRWRTRTSCDCVTSATTRRSKSWPTSSSPTWNSSRPKSPYVINQDSRRHQTPPPAATLLPPAESFLVSRRQIRAALWWINLRIHRWYMLACLRGPIVESVTLFAKKQKYVVYCNTATVTGNVRGKFGKVWTRGFWDILVVRHTHRPTDRLFWMWYIFVRCIRAGRKTCDKEVEGLTASHHVIVAEELFRQYHLLPSVTRPIPNLVLVVGRWS